MNKVEEDTLEYKRAKLLQMWLEGFQLGSWYMLFMGIGENLLQSKPGHGIFNRQGFKPYIKSPFYGMFIFSGFFLSEFYLFKKQS